MLAIWTMGSLTMAAMMLLSALPMVLTFVNLSVRSRQQARGCSFSAADAGMACLQRSRGGRAVGVAGHELGPSP